MAKLSGISHELDFRGFGFDEFNWCGAGRGSFAEVGRIILLRWAGGIAVSVVFGMDLGAGWA